MNACTVTGCGAVVKARGWCTKHYKRWIAKGDPLAMKQAENGTGCLNNQGYRAMRRNGKQLSEHAIVAEKALGRPLPKGVQVHHVNEDKADNRGSNLVICPDAAYHSLLHLRTRAYDACGHADWRRCSRCREYDEIENMPIRSKNGNGVTPRYFHTICPHRIAGRP